MEAAKSRHRRNPASGRRRKNCSRPERRPAHRWIGAGGICRARRRVSGPGRRLAEFCWAIRPCPQAVQIPQRVAAWPLDAYSLAVACGDRGVSLKTPVPPAIRRAGLRALPATGHDIGSLLRPARDLAPRPVALCTPNWIVGLARYPRAAAQWPSRKRPLSRATATWRSVPLRRVDRTAARLRRGTLDTSRCRHRRQTFRPATPLGASDCGGPYHAIITPASVACLAGPLPPLAWMPI